MSIFTDDSVKTIKVLNGSADITEYVKSDSFSVENILCDGQLAFGTCNSARAQMTTITDLNLTGATITVQYGSGTTFENIGVYKVTYSSQTENSDEVVVTMYDCVKAFDVDVSEWYENLSFPMSLLTFRTALCTYIGVTTETVSLVNDDMTIYKTIAPSQLNGKDVLRYIGEINGVFPHATRSGTFTWLSLGTVATTVPASLVQGADGVVQKDYTTASIGALVIRTEDGDVGVTVGSGTNTYYVTANVLCYGLTTAQLTPIATNLCNKIYAVQYVPTSISMKCIPTYEMGALLSYGGNHFYILEKKTNGLMFDDISCEGNEYLSEPSSIQTQLEQLRGKSAVLSASIEGVSSRVTDIEEDYTTYTEFSQTADSLTLAITDLQNEIDGSIEIIYTDGEPTLTNYPAWDWTDMRAFDSDEEATAAGDVAWKASDELQFLYNDDGYDPHRRTMVYDQTNSVTYRFIQTSGQWVWQVLENTEFSVVLEKISALELTTDGITAEVSAVEADLEDNYFNKSETTSLLSQTSTSIMASVSGTYATKSTTTDLQAQISLKIDPTNLISSINESADVIELEGHRISITSDYFTLTTDGRITATGGTIGGFTIGSTSLNNGMTSLSDTSHNGVYVGTDGIALGKGAFKVTKAGALSASSVSITGGKIEIEGESAGDRIVILDYESSSVVGHYASALMPSGMYCEYYGQMGAGTTELQQAYYRGSGINFGNGGDTAPYGYWRFTTGDFYTEGSVEGRIKSLSVAQQMQNGSYKYCVGSNAEMELRFTGSSINVYINGTRVGNISLS